MIHCNSPKFSPATVLRYTVIEVCDNDFNLFMASTECCIREFYQSGVQ